MLTIIVITTIIEYVAKLLHKRQELRGCQNMSEIDQNIRISLTKEEFKRACRISLSTNPDFTVSETEEGFIVKELNAKHLAFDTITYRATATISYLGNGNVNINVSSFGLGPIQKKHVTQVCSMVVNMIRISEDQAVQRKQTASNSFSSVGISIPEQIKQLAELKEAGIITEDEFKTKKEQLLAKL